MPDKNDIQNKQNKTTQKPDNQKIDFLAPLDDFKMPADDAVQEAGSRAAITGDLAEAPYSGDKGKTGKNN